MKRKIISIVVAIALVVVGVGGYMLWNRDAGFVFAAEYREGYVVEPVDIDETGVAITSSFMFKWNDEVEPVTLEELAKNLNISPDVEFDIETAEEGFVVSPKEELQKNTLYVFEFKGITWVYKTEAEFAVIGTFPRDKSTNVPVNTGIEFVFNYPGAEVEDYVSFEPAIKGRFEVHNKVVVFVPKELEEKTVYTVTIKAGLPLGDSDKALQEEVVFSFETEAENRDDYNGYVGFDQIMTEYCTTDVPNIPWNYYFYDEEANREVDVEIYAYRSATDFANALDSFSAAPFWSYYGVSEQQISTDNMDKAMDFSLELESYPDYPNFLTLPDTLEQGYYLVNVKYEEQVAQTFIQISDLSYYYQQDDNGDVFWVNDLEDGMPMEGVTVTEFIDGTPTELGVTDSEGLFTSLGARDSRQVENKVFLLTDGTKETVVYAFGDSWWYGNGGENGYFWKYFKTDRSLYLPDDVVEFFGFTKSRYTEDEVKTVTVEISQGGYYYWDFLPYSVDSLPLVTTEVAVNDGFYQGRLDLPNLAEGYYQVMVKDGDDVIASSHVSVEKYVKPSYKIEVETDKEAIFVDDMMEFTVKTSFFEGTPVSFLDFNYNVGGVDWMEDRDTTDEQGQSVFKFNPEYRAGYQGPQYYYFSAYADLPESGSIYVNKNFRVFFNDITVMADASKDKEQYTLDINVNEVTLDRINGEDSEDNSEENYYYYYDNTSYKGDPTEGTNVDVTIYRNEWIRHENGEYYDYINKEVRKQYYYDLETTKVDTFSGTTDVEGQLQFEFTRPEEKDVYYHAVIETRDHKDRYMEFKQYFGESYEYEPYYGDYYHIEMDQESYKVGETVTGTFLNGQTPHEEGEYLFVLNQNGIVDAVVTDGPVFEQSFEEAYVPAVGLSGVYFNGRTYLAAGSAYVAFDVSSKTIDLSIESDKDSYKPGETVTVDITATTIDANGDFVPVKNGRVNLSLVDEALLALRDMTIDPLNELYGYIDTYPLLSYSSHGQGIYGGFGRGYGMVEEMAMDMASDDSMENGAMPKAEMTMEFSEAETARTDGGAEVVSVRSEFKDTALYAVIQLDDNGKASLTFTLPHNVTSWRVTGAAISTELQAGSQVEEMRVTLPFFLNTSLSQTYLVGDKPFIGVTAYGTELMTNDRLDYNVVVENILTGEEVFTSDISGNAFERVNLSMGQLNTAGLYKATVTGLREDGTGDALELTFEVVDTYHTTTINDYYTLTEGLKIVTNSEGNTRLTFVDEGKGYYLPTLYRLAYSGGKRVDQKYLGDLAKAILNERFGTDLAVADISVTDYMPGDGGIAILPYAESDVETTVNMLPLIMDQVNTDMILMYLQNSWYNENLSEKGAVLYGLAQLGEPVLYDLSQYASVNNLSDVDKMYVALAYVAFGDTYMAKELYEEVVDGHVEEFEQRAYVDMGDENEDFYMTLLAMSLAEKADLDIHSKYYDYMIHTYSKEYSPNAILLDYALSQMEQVDQREGRVTYEYNGRTVEVELNGWGRSITIPSATLNRLNITQVEGDLAVVASYDGPLTGQVEMDSDLTVSRRYYSYQTGEETTTFNQGDIVKVVLDWHINLDSIDSSYELKDFVPSGLEAIDNPWNYGFRSGGYSWFRDVEDQQVSFYIYKYKEMKFEPFVYYARVTSPGEFLAEAPIIQGNNILDSMFVGERDTITITE